MWQTITFKLSQELEASLWKARNKNNYQIVEVFINNGYCYEYRPLRRF